MTHQTGILQVLSRTDRTRMRPFIFNTGLLIIIIARTESQHRDLVLQKVLFPAKVALEATLFSTQAISQRLSYIF